jgi:trypsin-like peptidase
MVAAVGWIALGLSSEVAHALQQAGGVQAGEPKFRLVRSVSGSKGSLQAGQYVIEDPRDVFYVPGDTKITVYFEWEGPLGLHHLEGIWKNPEGKIVSLSDFDYESKQKRFGVYFSVPILESIPPGLWSVEAHIDGELAGTHTFQILAASKPATTATAKVFLAPGEIYQRAMAATVVVQALGADGATLTEGSGFFVAENVVLTGFENIDGASAVRVTLAGGRQIEAEGVLVSSRLGDWALLRVQAPKSSLLPIAPNKSWQVGDRCFSLDEPQENNRTIVDGNITGERTFPEIGDRLDLSFAVQSGASGSPLINEYGEAIGMVVVRSLLPGSKSLSAMRKGLGAAYPGNLFGSDSPFRSENQLAIPISAVQLKTAESPVTSLSQLAANGSFTPALAGFENIMSGTVARRIDRKGSLWEPVEQKFEYSHEDDQIVIFIIWSMRSKLKGLASLRLYGLNNQLAVTSRPKKISLSKGQMSYLTYPLEISKVPSGTYRVDLVIDTTAVWRTFIRVRD